MLDICLQKFRTKPDHTIIIMPIYFWKVLSIIYMPLITLAHVGASTTGELNDSSVTTMNETELEELRHHISAIEVAITRKGKLDHTVLQGAFLGPARSGKSSLIRRLLKEKFNPTSPSTGAADKVIHVCIKKVFVYNHEYH